LINDSPTSATSPFISPPDESGETPTAEAEEVADGEEETTQTAGEEAPTSAASATGESLRQVSTEEAAAYAKEAGNLLFFEASAKTGQGVQELFTEIGESSTSFGTRFLWASC
jgi:hypothetical protein